MAARSLVILLTAAALAFGQVDEGWKKEPAVTGLPASESAAAFEGEPKGEVAEEGEEGDEGEEEEEVTGVDVGIAFTLMGSLSFGIVLFYFVNYGDDDIRRYSWLTISMTISIFCAVLIFGGIDKLVCSYLLPPEPSPLENMIKSYVMLLCFLVALQFTVACQGGFLPRIAGLMGIAIDDSVFLKQVWLAEDDSRKIHGTEVPAAEIIKHHWGRGIAMGQEDGFPIFARLRRPEKEKLERRLKCWTTLMSHTMGFSAISAGVSLQHLGWFETNAFSALLAALLNYFLLLVVFRISGALAPWTEADKGGEEDEEADKIVNAGTTAKEVRQEIAEKEVDEAEIDVLALSSSFHLVQCIKFGMTGVLAGEEGYEEPMIETTTVQQVAICGSAVLFVIVMLVFYRTPLANCHSSSSMIHQQQHVFPNVCVVSAAWCLLFGARYVAVDLYMEKKIPYPPSSMEVLLGLAIVLSAFGLLMIFALDYIEDSNAAPAGQPPPNGKARKPVWQRALQNAIVGVGLLIGLSWEKCFDGAVEAASSTAASPLMMNLAWTIAVVVVLVPAWRRYILAKQIFHEQVSFERKHPELLMNLHDDATEVEKKSEHVDPSFAIWNMCSVRSPAPSARSASTVLLQRSN